MTGVLASWNDGTARRAVVEFAEQTVSAGVPPAERVAVFDNDGTLWCEKPMPIQADFILRRLAEMAQADPGLRGRQPWKAAYERDYGWLGKVLAEHYAGNDTNLATLMAGVLAAYDGISVEDFEAKSDAFLRTAQHPTLGRGYLECAYAPMVELLGYLDANGFTNYIASGGGRDFMRPISQEVYGIPRDRVIGSATTFQYTSRGSPFNRSRLAGWPGLVAACITHGPWASSRHGSAPMPTVSTTSSGCGGRRGSCVRSAATAGAGGSAMPASCASPAGIGPR